MDLLIIVSNPLSRTIARELSSAAGRAGISWSIFFTNDGVRVLEDEAFIREIKTAQNAVSCHESWQTHMGEKSCPVEKGSQTNNSALAAKASRIISL